jgi:hypothetical protein
MIGKGDLTESDLLWKEGSTDWVLAKLFFKHLDEIKEPTKPRPKAAFKFLIIVDTTPSIIITEQRTIRIEQAPVK